MAGRRHEGERREQRAPRNAGPRESSRTAGDLARDDALLRQDRADCAAAPPGVDDEIDGLPAQRRTAENSPDDLEDFER